MTSSPTWNAVQEGELTARPHAPWQRHRRQEAATGGMAIRAPPPIAAPPAAPGTSAQSAGPDRPASAGRDPGTARCAARGRAARVTRSGSAPGCGRSSCAGDRGRACSVMSFSSCSAGSLNLVGVLADGRHRRVGALLIDEDGARRRIERQRRSGVPTSMRRRCGCDVRSAMVFTSAKAMSASARRCSSVSRERVANTSPTVLSVERAVADPFHHVLEARIIRQRRHAEHVGAELLPLPLALDRDQDVLAVLGAEHAIGCDRGMCEAHALRRIAGLRSSAAARSASRPSRRTSRSGCQPPGRCASARSVLPAPQPARWRRWRRRRSRRRHAKAPSGPPVIEARPLSAWISRS